MSVELRDSLIFVSGPEAIEPLVKLAEAAGYKRKWISPDKGMKAVALVFNPKLRGVSPDMTSIDYYTELDTAKKVVADGTYQQLVLWQDIQAFFALQMPKKPDKIKVVVGNGTYTPLLTKDRLSYDGNSATLEEVLAFCKHVEQCRLYGKHVVRRPSENASIWIPDIGIGHVVQSLAFSCGFYWLSSGTELKDYTGFYRFAINGELTYGSTNTRLGIVYPQLETWDQVTKYFGQCRDYFKFGKYNLRVELDGSVRAGCQHVKPEQLTALRKSVEQLLAAKTTGEQK